MRVFCEISVPRFKQEPWKKKISGDFTCGDKLADAVISRIPEQLGWRSLLVSVRLSVPGEQENQGQAKSVTGAHGLRSQIRLEFGRLASGETPLPNFVGAQLDMVAARL